VDSRPVSSLSPRSLLRQRELELARRLGRWETAEDRLLVREHQTRQVLAKAGRGGAIGLLVVAWFVPLLWPFALLGSLRMFPRTSRRVALGVVGGGALSLTALVLLLGLLTRPLLSPPEPSLPPAAVPSLPSAAPVLPSGSIGLPGEAPGQAPAAIRSPG
jgi:hypothetical protein